MADPHAKTSDGHIVSHDGFIVPRNFSEFFSRFPKHVRGFVRRHMIGKPPQDVEDRESDLLCFLMSLPETSKYRKPKRKGSPAACSDRIMTFDPDRSFGATQARFLSYINRILFNRFLSLESKRQHEPVTRSGTLRLISDEEIDDPATGIASDIEKSSPDFLRLARLH